MFYMLSIRSGSAPKVNETIIESDDPFVNFEKQWSQLNKN